MRAIRALHTVGSSFTFTLSALSGGESRASEHDPTTAQCTCNCTASSHCLWAFTCHQLAYLCNDCDRWAIATYLLSLREHPGLNLILHRVLYEILSRSTQQFLSSIFISLEKVFVLRYTFILRSLREKIFLWTTFSNFIKVLNSSVSEEPRLPQSLHDSPKPIKNVSN